VYGGFPPITAVKEGYLWRQAGVAEVAEVAGIAQEEKRGLTEPYMAFLPKHKCHKSLLKKIEINNC
jgi:hypothetical protein